MIDGRSDRDTLGLQACACSRCADINACIHACAAEGVSVTDWFPLIVLKVEEVIGDSSTRARSICPLWRAEAEGIIQVLRGDAVLAMALGQCNAEEYMRDVLKILVQAMQRLVSYRTGPECDQSGLPQADSADNRFAA